VFSIEFHSYWEKYFAVLSEELKIRVIKKIHFLSEYPKSQRHLKFGIPFYVSELGQYRITYKIFESEHKIMFYFVGDHKEYEKWYSSILE
jgi:hypothetical protein